MVRSIRWSAFAFAAVTAVVVCRCQCGSPKTGSDGGTNDAGTADSGPTVADSGQTATDSGNPGGSDGGPGFDAGSGSVLQHHRNPSRDGFYVDPYMTQAAIDAGLRVDPGFNATLNGDAWAQPLFMENGPGGKDTLFVATTLNDVYALDALDGGTIWHTNLGPTVSSVPTPPGGCGSVWPLGILGTPVIDAASRRLYLDSLTKVGGKTTHLIHSLSVDTGADGWTPLDVAATISGFDSQLENQRGALALLNGVLYVPYGGYDGDCGNYRGIVVGVPLNNPTAATAWSTPYQSGPGIWAPSGIASDGTSLFVATGNTNSPFTQEWDAGDSEAILKLNPGPSFVEAPQNFFAPTDWLANDNADTDLGSSGVVLFDAPGTTPPHLAFAIGKTTHAYLVDRDNLGGITDGLSTPLLQSNNQVFGSLFAYQTSQGTYVGVPWYFNACQGDFQVLKVSATAQLSEGWCGQGSTSGGNGGNGSPIASTTGNLQNVVVWAYGSNTDETLRAYDGDTGNLIASAPGLPNGSPHWISPIIAKGRVYVGGYGAVMAWTVR